MLDVFTRPDMTRDEVHEAVQETTQRAEASLAAAGSTMLNGPIQGGLHADLRRMSARGMGAHGFSVHPIGGIVPVMEQQRYADLARIMLASMPELPPSARCTCLVVDIRCSSPCSSRWARISSIQPPMPVCQGRPHADANRYRAPWGPPGVARADACVASLTPEDVRKMDDDERMVLLSRFNLEVTLAELAACRQAVMTDDLGTRRTPQPRTSSAARGLPWLTTSPARGPLQSPRPSTC